MRPDKGDYAEYYQKYIDLVQGDDIFRILVEQNMESQNILNSFSESKGAYRYAEGKWTVKEVIGHMMDIERIFAYRALCIARGEKQPLPGMDQNIYAAKGNFNKRQLFDLNYEFRLLRESNILLFGGFDKSVLQNRGNASGYDVTVLALMFMTAGHEKHHLNILTERYM
ncbi:MAG: DinB family protein [Ignavibacterium sp.]|nr:DinB family protein [Ignavibacterium sp.]HCY74552.1 DNA damage-inducible protein DinB [Ignavibacteriales bacterium]